MYTSEQLQGKSLPELKEIGWQLNALPDGDRRLRRNWIRAIEQAAEQAGDRSADEFFASSEVNEVEPENSQNAIVPVAENFPGVEVDPVQEPIEQAAKKPGVNGAKVAAQRQKVIELLEQKNLAELDEIAWRVNVLPEGDPQCRQNWIDALVNVDIRILQYLCRQVQVEDPVQEPIAQAVKNTLGAEVDQRQEPIETQRNEEARPQLDRAESAHIHNLGFHSAKSDGDSSGAKTEALGSQEGDRVLAVAGNHQTVRGRVLPDRSIKLVNQPQEPIAQAAQNFPGVETDRILIIPGIKLSERFLSLYASPSFSRTHEIESNGQLKLEQVTDPEPPDPDYYSTLSQFWAVMNAWNAAYPDSVEEFRDFDSQQNADFHAAHDRWPLSSESQIICAKNEPTIRGTDTQCERSSEMPRNNCVPSGCDSGSYRNRVNVDRPHGLESGKEGDRILAISRNGEGDSGRDLSHQLVKLAP